MQETDKLKLRKPEYNEYADVADLNHNMNILDEKVDGKLGKTEKAADSEKLDGLDSLMFARSYSFANNDFIPKDIFNNPAHLQSYIGGINYGKEAGLPDDFSKIIFLPSNLDGYGTQIAIPYGSGDTFGVYYRNATTKTWNSWLELLDTRERNGLNPTTDAPGDDANNCLETGKAYSCTLDRTKNIPIEGVSDDGIIIPYMVLKGQFGSQIFMPLDSTSIWLRIVKNSTWSKWHCIGGGSWNQEIQKDSEQVSKFQRWEHYGKDHVIFDASKSLRPDGQPCDRTNSNQPWTAANCPTLMGFNGHTTWGVRVDSARNSDQVQGFQFRNNNGRLEVLVGGEWLQVGGRQYAVTRVGTLTKDNSSFSYSGGSGILRSLVFGYTEKGAIIIDGVSYAISDLQIPSGDSQVPIIINIEFKNSITINTRNGHIRYVIQTEK